MAKKKEKQETFLVIEIIFPKAPKKAKDKKTPFNKLLSLIEESKESLPIKVKSEKRKRYIVLDSDEFMFSISFGKTGSTISTRVTVHKPEKNIEIANEVGNKVINYMNTVLGEGATGSRIASYKTILHPEEIPNLAAKVIGEGRIAKINEAVKQTLSPTGIIFEYKTNGRDFAFASMFNERSTEMLLSRITYKGKMPFDLLRIEHDELAKPAGVLKKLTEMEL